MEFLVSLYPSELLWVYKREWDFSISVWISEIYFWRASFSERAAKALLFVEVGSMIFIPMIFCLTSHQIGWYRVVAGMLSCWQLTSQCITSMSIFFDRYVRQLDNFSACVFNISESVRGVDYYMEIDYLTLISSSRVRSVQPLLRLVVFIFIFNVWYKHWRGRHTSSEYWRG